MENGSISNELGMMIVTIKEEPVNFDDYEVYGMGNSNSNLQQWVIDAFGRVIVKEEVPDLEFSELFFFDDSEESPDCNFEGFHDDDMQICIKKESIDPSSPTINAELNFPKRNITLNSSNLSNSNSVETSVRNESDTTEIEDAVETSVRNKSEQQKLRMQVET
ncbi:hypothetical protein Avbf_16314 [Armadillidium vulgare]|nr:hypothetical protein Avbf_16314 [Armadillidium vulgare]